MATLKYSRQDAIINFISGCYAYCRMLMHSYRHTKNIEIAQLTGKPSILLGWLPRRSIRICSWGAGVYGNIGSIEWIEV